MQEQADSSVGASLLLMQTLGDKSLSVKVWRNEAQRSFPQFKNKRICLSALPFVNANAGRQVSECECAAQ